MLGALSLGNLISLIWETAQTLVFLKALLVILTCSQSWEPLFREDIYTLLLIPALDIGNIGNLLDDTIGYIFFWILRKE